MFVATSHMNVKFHTSDAYEADFAFCTFTYEVEPLLSKLLCDLQSSAATYFVSRACTYKVAL